MKKYVYIDNSNVWIEGKRVAAVEQDLAFDIWDALQNNIQVATWKYDFGKLLELVGGLKNGLQKAVLFGSRPPQNDSLWAAAEHSGFEVVVENRNSQNQEKKIDTGIAAAMMDDAIYAVMNNKIAETELVLVAGDGDYVPVITRLIARGFKVTVCFWEHASRELKETASEFVPLNPHVNHITR